LDWTWLVRQAKLRNLQNRLGFLTEVASALSRGAPAETAMKRTLKDLDQARLLAETTFCWDSMPASIRQWMRENRSAEAAHWNVLTRLMPEQLNDAQNDAQ
jgi:hypothetical protein